MHICKLGLPNLEYYFWAAQLKPLTAWLRDLTDARWLNIEKSLCQQSLSELPFLDITLKNTEMGEWTMSTLKIWREIQSLLKLPRPISSLTSIGSIRNFIPAQLDMGFRRWSEYGLQYIHQLFEKGTMKSFEKLRNNFLLPKTDFFRYLQLRHLLTAQKDWAKIANPTGLEQF